MAYSCFYVLEPEFYGFETVLLLFHTQDWLHYVKCCVFSTNYTIIITIMGIIRFLHNNKNDRIGNKTTTTGAKVALLVVA